MPKDRERVVNPATAALKASKNRAIKKSKATVAQQRAERLSKRNPDRLQRQIDELKEAKEAGQLRGRDVNRLEELEKEVRMVRKAREHFGIQDDDEKKRRPPRRDDSGGVLGKRRREDGEGRARGGRRSEESESSETDEEVRNIPMPKDVKNMPPVPRRRHPRRNGATSEDLDLSLPAKPPTSVAPAQTVYEAKPVLRDLTKEATSRFMPAAVAMKLKKAKGETGLLEPEELDQLEKAGYADPQTAMKEVEKEVMHSVMSGQASGEEMRRFEQEIAAFGGGQSLKDAAMENVKKAGDEAEKVMVHDMIAEKEAKDYRQDEIMADAENAADEAEKEALHVMMADDTNGQFDRSVNKPEKKVVSKLAGLIGYSDEDEDEDEEGAYEAAEHVVDTAEKEAESNIMTEGVVDKPGNHVTQVKKSQQHFRRVEIEEVSDEDL
jgi:hypothetical protein